jgi:hypothetical protein
MGWHLRSPNYTEHFRHYQHVRSVATRVSNFEAELLIRGFGFQQQFLAWRCMFEPIRAQLAPSRSRNGISEAAAIQSGSGYVRNCTRRDQPREGSPSKRPFTVR